jgi:hypothetical protein
MTQPMGLPNMRKFLRVEDRNFARRAAGPEIQPANISPVASFETETPAACVCWSDRPYAALRASHRYLVADFVLTLLRHLCAALVSRAV